MDVHASVALSALRDIEGVLGSFLVDVDGQILARDLPPLFDVDALASASVHLSRLRAALELDGNALQSCVARFGPHLLLLRAAQENTLCVLCPHGTNMPAVHMSTTLIARRLSHPANGVRVGSSLAADAIFGSDAAGTARSSFPPSAGTRVSYPPASDGRDSYPGRPPSDDPPIAPALARRFRGRPV
jgi:predicted regulator of Ras-like GTPase activity (Roadblock/LC7/MglB family)